MTIEFNISIEGAAKAERMLRKLPGMLRRHLRRAMAISVSEVRRGVQTYPKPIPPGHWKALTTRAQKAAFFAKLREGGWARRTGTLGRRWKARVVTQRSGVVGIVENPTPYAPEVQGPGTQAAFHHGRWVTPEQVIRKEEKQIIGFFEKGLEAAVREAERRA